jgi:hypothetical protein
MWMSSYDDRAVGEPQTERYLEVGRQRAERDGVIGDAATASAHEVKECDEVGVDVAAAQSDRRAQRFCDLPEQSFAHDEPEVLAVAM